MRAFRATGPTVKVSMDGTSKPIKVSDDKGDIEVRVFNNGTATAWIEFGVTGLAAEAANGIPIGPGVTEVHRTYPAGGALFAAAIAAGSTGDVYFTPGEGI
jgi:hypothetical protein